jgi:hypothetical protein
MILANNKKSIISRQSRIKHSRQAVTSVKEQETTSCLQQCGPNNFPADKSTLDLLGCAGFRCHIIFFRHLFFPLQPLPLLPLLKVPKYPHSSLSHPYPARPFALYNASPGFYSFPICVLSLLAPLFPFISLFSLLCALALASDGGHLACAIWAGAHHGCPRPQLFLWLR